MKHVLFLVCLLVVLLGTFCKPKAEPKQEEPAKVVTAPSPQPAKDDSNGAANWPDALDAIVAAPQNHKVVLDVDSVNMY